MASPFAACDRGRVRGEAFGHACAASTQTALDTLVGPFFIGRDPDPRVVEHYTVATGPGLVA